MYFKTTYEDKFDDLWMHLKAKYPDKLFDLDGIGKQLDMSEFSRNFFSSKVTSDASIDANANVDDTSVIAYSTELPKPFLKINSYYILWKELKRLYSHEVANSIIEMQLTGDIYIHDAHGIGAGKPYSYHPDTVLCLRIDGEIIYCTMKDLYDMYGEYSADNGSYEEIDTTTIRYAKKVDYPKNTGNTEHIQRDFMYTSPVIEILDDNNTWVNISRVLRHRTDKKLLKVNTKSGLSTIITSDHPVILNDMTEVAAENLRVGDVILKSSSSLPLSEKIFVNSDFAYLVGFWIGDGWGSKRKDRKTCGQIGIKQKNISSSKIYEIAKRYFDNTTVLRHDDGMLFGATQTYNLFCNDMLMGRDTYTRKLPKDILHWNKEAKISLLCGIIDSDGTVNKDNGHIQIRVGSFALVQQVSEILKALGITSVRTSFVAPQSIQSGYETKCEMYRVSFRLEQRALEFMESEKISQNIDICRRVVGLDGRFETDEVLNICEYKNPIDYVYDITTESGHFHCQGMIQHNCFNYSTYDLMLKGLPMVKKVKSLPPKYLYAFKSQLEQFTVIASNSTLGATGLADLLVVMSYYVKRILGTKSDAHFKFASVEDCWSYVKENLVSMIYTINQPMRGNQSPFTNISVYDKYFLETMSEDYIFPDGSNPDLEIIQKLQEIFLDIMNEELSRTMLTFPVTTACLSIDKDKNIQDESFLKMVSEKNLEFGFINIYCGDSSTISSCCRLRSDGVNEYFNSFGSGSTKIGSLGVCSINFPRLAIKYPDRDEFMEELKKMVEVSARVNNAKRRIIEKRINNGNEPLYTFGFMELSKQYSTTGVNGFNECIELLGEDILKPEGQKLAIEILEVINAENEKQQRKYKAPHNEEQVPGENMSIKMADKDRLLRYQDCYDIYSNQFIPLVTNADMLDRINLQGMFDGHFSGGAICHLNVDTTIDCVDSMANLIRTAAKRGVVYFAINYVLSECEQGHMIVSNDNVCTVCGGEIVNKFTRVVGFLTNVKNWHRKRREEDFPNRQFYKGV